QSTWLIVTFRLLLFLSAVSAAACSGSSAASRTPPSTADTKPVPVVRVERAPLSRTVTVTGTLAAEEQVMLSLKVTGRLDDVLVDLGSHGQRGQVLARLSS